MESGVGAGAMPTDHEPGIPGGETPPFTAGGTPAATDATFRGSGVGAGAMLTDHELGGVEGRLRARLRLRLRRERRFMESGQFKNDLPTDLEPGRAGTPVS